MPRATWISAQVDEWGRGTRFRFKFALTAQERLSSRIAVIKMGSDSRQPRAAQKPV
jgi:hypothetical protein